ncbi:TPA: RidA family protein [Vibrio parahaemolyticus]|uniref:RidA family protein n=1 Tax=Vibrio parahaemolyticus TaxID=670 RepID=UPI000A3878CC|nr:Rid family hydrolase [Vibrio parahaemolyticus]MDF4705939.1 Rid family hydrolase [Vibrio parahaemolyticus]OUD49499.1 enamine deaminase RidA [Vibrio parahaemolyticus]HCE2222736.1 RidA family protein [Vibrio parahaemolyticus]HCG7235824.1 RidA family protein [Vibrio parahaemolyticus]
MLERMNYEFLPEAQGPYVHAMKHNQVLYVSGLTALNTCAQSSELDGQIEEILRQLTLILAEENKSVTDIIKATIFLRNMDQLSLMREHLRDFYKGIFPACSLVEVSRFIDDDLKVEMEVMISLASN